MKKLFMLILAATTFATASAQIDFGIKGGLNVNKISLSSDVVSSSNKAGFYIGPTAKFTIPLIGLGFDVSALYDQREGKINGVYTNTTVRQQQIAIPINLRYQVGLGDLASVLFFAGPQFGFNVGSDIDEINWEWKKNTTSINVGAGVMLLNHLQINANYNIACGKSGECVMPVVDSSVKMNGKFNTWQIGLAYYF